MSISAPFRIGQIVPSSNTTMETEIPAMLNRHGAVFDRNFTYHSSRMRMKKVTAEELKAMDADSHRCAAELADARVDIMGYACLVAIMSAGKGYHRTSQANLEAASKNEGSTTPVVTSAGALIEGLHAMGAKKVSIITPYMRPLTNLVIDYIEDEGVEVKDSIALEIPDNLEVARQDPAHLIGHLDRLDTKNVDAVILSACVQMPSLPAIQSAENKLGIPVTSAAACTVRSKLIGLGLEPIVPGCGAFLVEPMKVKAHAA